MKLTLRKANAVQAAINEANKALELESQVRLNEFEEVLDRDTKELYKNYMHQTVD